MDASPVSGMSIQNPIVSSNPLSESKAIVIFQQQSGFQQCHFRQLQFQSSYVGFVPCPQAVQELGRRQQFIGIHPSISGIRSPYVSPIGQPPFAGFNVTHLCAPCSGVCRRTSLLHRAFPPHPNRQTAVFGMGILVRGPEQLAVQ